MGDTVVPVYTHTNIKYKKQLNLDWNDNFYL